MKNAIEVSISEAGDASYRIGPPILSADGYGMILADLMLHFSIVLSRANGTDVDREAVMIAMRFLQASETPPSQRVIPQGPETLQ